MGANLGKALLELYTKGKTNIIFKTHRDDGFVEVRDIKKYIEPYSKFPEIQKKALKHARGKVLDVGAGGGKHSLYLQEKGLKVTAIDLDDDLIKLMKKRGVKDVRKVDLFKMDFGKEKFDTVLLMGNGLSFGGSPTGLKRFLNKLYRITSKEGVVIGDSTNIKKTKRGLMALNDKRQFKLRVEVDGNFSPWFVPFFVSDYQFRKIVKETKWKIKKLYLSKREDVFSVVLEKRRI